MNRLPRIFFLSVFVNYMYMYQLSKDCLYCKFYLQTDGYIHVNFSDSTDSVFNDFNLHNTSIQSFYSYLPDTCNYYSNLIKSYAVIQ